MTDKDRYYPKLDEKMMAVVAKIYENDANYFADPACPYSPEVKDIYQKRAKHNDFDSHNKDLKSSDGLLEEINLLVSQLKQYWQEIQSGQGTTPADKNTYFRLAYALIEKMIVMKERVLNIKEYEAFTTVVLDVLDKELEPDARNRVLERFKNIGSDLTVDDKEAITLDTTDETGNKNDNKNTNEISFTLPEL